MDARARESNSRFGRGLARAGAGAVIFGLPLLMTMEMWFLGFSMGPGRLALLLACFFPFLVALSWHAGFEATFSWRDDVLDALVAYAVGFVTSAVVLLLFGVIAPGMPVLEVAGKVSLQAIPASIGALLAQTQLGERETGEDPRGGAGGYASELYVMSVGALFLSFNLAPTEEMLLIAVQAPGWLMVVLMLLSLGIMHAFVYSVSFRGAAEHAEAASSTSLFLRYTVVGYALVLLLSAAMLWAFGRFDGLSPLYMLMTAAVLGLPAAVGAAAARLIL